MFVFKTLFVIVVWQACVHCQSHNGPTTTPVPILKQINRQNDDGSYSFGFEAADGSFKIETKYPNGDVAGKYGYVDESGQLREITYGASSERGFEPQGYGIMVPPPTLHEPSNALALSEGQEDDGQYREDPKIYEDPKYNGKQSARPAAFRQTYRPVRPESQPQEPQYEQQVQTSHLAGFNQPAPIQSGPRYSQQTSLFNQAPQQFPQGYRPQSQIYHQQPQFSYQAYTPQPYNQYQNNFQQADQNHQTQNYNPFIGHPAQNFNPYTGSYSINYTG